MPMSDKCRLCGKSCSSFAKSHLIPKGFLAKSEYAHKMSLVAERCVSKRMCDGVYDRHILCEHCESKYFQDPDNYGITIFRDLKGAMRHSFLTSEKQIVRWRSFSNVDRRLLRAFIASVLWRCSVSKQDSVCNFRLSNYYEKKIADDLIRNGQFEYVDAVAILNDASNLPEEVRAINDSLIMPQRVLQDCQGGETVCYDLGLPGLHLRISLGYRQIPYAVVPVRLEDPIGIFANNSLSIATGHEGEGLLVLESDYPMSLFGRVSRVVRNQAKLARRDVKRTKMHDIIPMLRIV